MTGVVGGFTALAAVIAVGWIVGRTGLLDENAPGVLSRLSFFVATPALLFLTLASADTTTVLSRALVATAGSAVLVAALYVGLRGGVGGRRPLSSRRAPSRPPT